MRKTVTLWRGWCNGSETPDGARAEHPPHIWNWAVGEKRYCSGQPDEED
jgi:hypothetical protein